MEIFLEAFFQRALIGGFLIALMAPLVGVFVVLRRLSMIGDTLAHVSIAGVALGFIIDVYPLGVGLLFSILAAFAIERLRKAYKTYAELSIAIIMSGGAALAALFFSLGKGFSVNVTSYLFGSILTLDAADLLVVAVVTVVVVTGLALNFKEIFLLSFDEDAAGVSGLPVRFYNILVTILTALVVSVAIKIVGALLVSSLLTIPVATSLVVSRSFKHTVVLSIVFSEAAVLAGLSISGVFGTLVPGSTIVLLLIAVLIVTLGLKRGLKL